MGQTLGEAFLLNRISLNTFYKPLRWVLMLSLFSHKRFVLNIGSYKTKKMGENGYRLKFTASSICV